MSSPQSYLDWTTLPFDPSELATRRHQLMRWLTADGGGVFLTPSRHHRSNGSTFRQLDDYYYFTGLELPDSVLAIDADRGEEIVFAPPDDPRFANPGRPNDFPGRPLQTDFALAQTAGLRPFQPLAALTPFLENIARQQRPVWINAGHSGQITPLQPGPFAGWTALETFCYFLQHDFPDLALRSAFAGIAHLRMIKSAVEIAIMRRACAITIDGIRTTAAAIRPGVDERSLEGILEGEFKKRGAQRLPFASIIKSGPNSLWPWRILAAHYNRRNRIMQPGELVVFDVGCEVDGYGADMGRTFAVDGRFSPNQTAVCQMQLDVLDRMIATMGPGITLAEVQQAGEAIIPSAARPYMQVTPFFGHHIGLSMGDPSTLDAPLAPGMIITVEPWYYNHDDGVAIFNEDVVLVTADGCENLTAALPRTPADLALFQEFTPI